MHDGGGGDFQAEDFLGHARPAKGMMQAFSPAQFMLLDPFMVVLRQALGHLIHWTS